MTQEQLAHACGEAVNRSAIAHLEQGLRVPPPDSLATICRELGIPAPLWAPFASPRAQRRLEVEAVLAELVGRSPSLDHADTSTIEVVDLTIEQLFARSGDEAEVTDVQARDLFGSLLVLYGLEPVSQPFFERYLRAGAFASQAAFGRAVERYQIDAIRLFSTLGEAWRALNEAGDAIAEVLAPLQPRSLDSYHARADWALLSSIDEDRLADLGYISAQVVRRESAERQHLESFLRDLAGRIRAEGRRAVEQTSTRVRRQMDSLLRKFDTEIEHGLFSPLFAPDPDELEREAARLAPRSDRELARMQETQEAGLGNLAQYLSADHMDVYVATSMRHRADFVSVDRFAHALFDHARIAPLKLRYFNPTQSWIDDRIAKGLVEALMLRRASVTIYMAQKADTFGKDSEASVALGQGKPVLVYVPRLRVAARRGRAAIDAEALFGMSRAELLALVPPDVAPANTDDDPAALETSVDDEALVARILARELRTLEDAELAEVVRDVWADFDLYGEAGRIEDESRRAEWRGWLDAVLEGGPPPALQPSLRPHLVGILVAVAMRFEGRARLFREIHPLALQVILSSGVLNGILVVRSVDQCAGVLEAILRNELSLSLHKDERNYRLVEQTTGSTVRVISRHRLLRQAYEAYELARRRELAHPDP